MKRKMFSEKEWRPYVPNPHRHKGQVVMRKFKLLTDNQLQREIDHTSDLIERNTNKYRINDLTRYLRRLQKERFIRERRYMMEQTNNKQMEQEIAFLKAEINNLFRQECELETRRKSCEQRLNQLLDEQAIKRAKGEQ